MRTAIIVILLIALGITLQYSYHRVNAIRTQLLGIESQRAQLRKDLDAAQAANQRHDTDVGKLIERETAAVNATRADSERLIQRTSDDLKAAQEENQSLRDRLSARQTEMHDLTGQTRALESRLAAASRPAVPASGLAAGSDGGVKTDRMADLRARALTASASERTLFDFISSQVASGKSINAVLGDARTRSAVAQSKLAQELVEALGGPRAPRDDDVDPPLTTQEKRQAVQNAASTSRRAFIEGLRQRLESGQVTVEEIMADPHMAAEMRTDPALRDLINSYRRANR